MAMAIAQPDTFSSTSVEGLIQSAALGASLSRSSSSIGNIGSSSSSSTSPDDAGEPNEAEVGPILARLLSNRDLFPMILGYLDTRSLLSLTSINQRFHREILTPATPNLCCLNTFLQQRTVVCPMAQFESLKDFMSKYRSFKPLHLHFTYSERSSFMSLVPEVSAPIYNSKQDPSFIHPSSSPLSTSHPYGVSQSISINVSSTNTLYQHHHPLPEDQHESQPILQSQPQRRLSHIQDENDQPLTSSSQANYSNNINTTTSQHAAVEQPKSARTSSSSSSSSSSSTNSAINDNRESSGEGKGRKNISEIESKLNGENKSLINDLDSKVAAMAIPSTNGVDLQYLQHQQQQQQQQKQQQLQSGQLVDYHDSNGNSSSSRSIHSSLQNGGPMDHNHSIFNISESIPVHSSSSTSTSLPPFSRSHHGFELSYWQKFALNELFMRLLPFLKTITIGRTDKPSRHAQLRDPTLASGELSPGVCFFLARCFNVMHDMPDTALESVIWMDVTPKDVALLVTMINLRDIMVDARYWNRGYWATDRPPTRRGRVGGDEDHDEQDSDDYDDEEDDWDGFYYLINQEGEEKRTVPPPPKKATPPLSGKAPQRKQSSIRGRTGSPSLSKQTTGLDPLVGNSSSSSSPSPSPSSTAESYAVSTSFHQPSSTTNSSNNRYNGNGIAPPAPWQGFGDGTPDVNSSNAALSLFPEGQLHPAVLMYESLKVEIADAALVARTLDKGKHPVTAVNRN
ncbi:hypothetical protein BGX21_002696 [Mortierella sp. AD011]|nr:hypothetical protein BGX20_001798 [Mortierella sp. AD010]KAF9401093.1 hypothetical protein BGX21_002696 [Mortierella sp. AD011]